MTYHFKNKINSSAFKFPNSDLALKNFNSESWIQILNLPKYIKNSDFDSRDWNNFLKNFSIDENCGVFDLEDKDYFELPALSNSLLKNLFIYKKQPLKLKYCVDNAFKLSEGTPAMKLGSLIHLVILENSKFKDNVKIFDGESKRTKEYKLFSETAKAEGKSVILQSEFEMLNKMNENIFSFPFHKNFNAFQRLFSENEVLNEKVFIIKYKDVYVKAKIDCLAILKDRLVLIDLKSTATKTADDFERQLFLFKYYFQMAIYKMLLEKIYKKPVECRILTIEKEEPYDVNFYKLSNDLLNYGRAEMIKAFNVFDENFK